MQKNKCNKDENIEMDMYKTIKDGIKKMCAWENWKQVRNTHLIQFGHV